MECGHRRLRCTGRKVFISKTKFEALLAIAREVLLKQTQVRRRATITISQAGSAQTGGVGYMPFSGKITAVTFMNDSGAAFSAAANSAVAAGTVASSSATLADNTSARTTTVANNMGLAEAAAITLTTGTTAGSGPTYAIVEVEETMVSV